MNILKHTHKSRKSCLICRVVGHKSAAEKPGRRELYPRELFVTKGPKKSANHERPAAWLWHTFPERTIVRGAAFVQFPRSLHGITSPRADFSHK
jgi:hypothetical protein